MNKKASLLDGMQIIIFLFAFGIITIISLFILNEFEAGSSDKLTSTQAIYAMNQGQATILNFDNLFVFILIGLIIATLIGAYFIQSNPIMFWISLLLLVIFLVISAILANTFDEIMDSDKLQETAANFEIINLVMDNLPLVLLVISALIMIALWAKWRGFV